MRRLLLSLLLGAQVLGAFVALADGRLEGPPRGTAHLESEGSDCCDPAHVHETCVLCQYLVQLELPVPFEARVHLPGDAIAASLSEAGDPPAIDAIAAPRGRSPPKV